MGASGSSTLVVFLAVPVLVVRVDFVLRVEVLRVERVEVREERFEDETVKVNS